MKVRVFLKSHDTNLLYAVSKNLRYELISKKSQVSGNVSLPIRKKRFCVLRSPHANSNAREHFEMRLSKQFFDINNISKKIIDFLLEIELPSGVSSSLNFI